MTQTSASTPETPWPVRVVSQKIGGWIARLGEVWVEGQIAEVSRRPGNGIVFLTLRDPSADISMSVTCRRHTFDSAELRDGARVIVRAKPDFYAARGTLSLRAEEFRAVGIGELLARLEKLKQALRAEGLFAPERKRPLPFLPNRVGLVTGRASAAERDVRQNAQRRWPAVRFEIRNVAVQGISAVSQVMGALKELDDDPAVDVIVLARGGGSLEDLLPFSDEALCRAIFACQTPVVSAIGHEPDTPIIDFVADVRCSTPTDAGKRVVPDLAEESQRLTVLRQRVRQCVVHRVEREQQWLEAVRSRPALAQPTVLIDGLGAEIDRLTERARRRFGHRLEHAESEVRHLLARVVSLSPQSTLDRGYAIAQAGDGSVLRSAAEVGEGDEVAIKLAVGSLTAHVASTAS